MGLSQSIERLGRWGRADGLVLQGLLGVVLVLQAVAGLVIPALVVAGVIDPDGRTVAVDDVAATGLPDAGGLTLSGAESATLTVADPSAEQRLLLELPALFGTVLILLGIYWLFQLVRSLCAGDPFRPRNPLRLYGIALLIAVGSIFGSLLEAVTTHQLVAGTPLAGHVPFSADISLLPLIVALLVAALAEAFRIGVRLRYDTAGLV